MVKEGNERVMITLSKQQANWLRKNAKKLHMNLSNFIKFLIDKNLAKFANQLTSEELDYLIKIAKVKWIKFDDNDYFDED